MPIVTLNEFPKWSRILCRTEKCKNIQDGELSDTYKYIVYLEIPKYFSKLGTIAFNVLLNFHLFVYVFPDIERMNFQRDFLYILRD